MKGVVVPTALVIAGQELPHLKTVLVKEVEALTVCIGPDVIISFMGISGIRKLEVEPSSRKGVRLVHRQIFKGLLVPILWPLMGAKTRSGFIRMNEALKEQSEKVQAASTLEQ